MKFNKSNHLKLTVVASAIAMSLPSYAGVLDDIQEGIKGGKTDLSMRYRIETVDQDGKDKDATASTLKTRLTWNSAKIKKFSAQIEVDNVSEIGLADYNSTTNGKTDYPVVADLEGTDLNLANIKYSGEKITVVIGRQRIAHNNQRFVGGVAWRQNEQTYDAVRFKYKASDKLNLDYSYVFNINRIFGPNDVVQPADWHGNFHLLNSKFSIDKNQKISVFAYLFDNEVALAASSNTYGIDYTGKFGPIKASLSYATQSDAGDNPNEYSASYYKAELGGKVGKVNVSAGYEVLGSDNGIGFSTPLATLHKFQGFADKFLGTPGNGVEDIYVSVSTKVNGVKLAATYHDLTANEGDASYGSEIDLVAAYKFNKQVSGLLKYASYDADDHATDTSKLWAMLTFKF